ncbi:MAG: alpha/beta fold hydrolase [Propionibacteriaceae bacterium]|nr:alpha/beta fold hydrolase [Propionibacteriaceae bacterium]
MHEETVIIGKGGEFPLEGVLTLPDSPHEALPALLLVHGSGPLNRDEKIGVLTPFKDIAKFLAANGIASLRYDKRTFVYGKKLRKELKNPTVREETIDDALAATKVLKADARINPHAVFLAGHSLGGMLAPRIDGEGGDYAGIIILAGSPRNLLDIIEDQNAEAIASLTGAIQFIAKKQVAALLKQIDTYNTWSLEESKHHKLINISAYYFKEMEAHPASDYLLQLNKPTLILQGGSDFQVSVDKDFGAYKALLKNHPNIKFHLYPGLSHTFTPSIYGNIMKAKQEYKVPGRVHEQVLDDIRDFIMSSPVDHPTASGGA